MAAKKTEETTEPIADEIEFVPSAALVEEVAPDTSTGELLEVRFEYAELRPWTRDTLVEQLNTAAADGWKLVAVVGTQIILERAH